MIKSQDGTQLIGSCLRMERNIVVENIANTLKVCHCIYT